MASYYVQIGMLVYRNGAKAWPSAQTEGSQCVTECVALHCA